MFTKSPIHLVPGAPSSEVKHVDIQANNLTHLKPRYIINSTILSHPIHIYMMIFSTTGTKTVLSFYCKVRLTSCRTESSKSASTNHISVMTHENEILYLSLVNFFTINTFSHRRCPFCSRTSVAMEHMRMPLTLTVFFI